MPRPSLAAPSRAHSCAPPAHLRPRQRRLGRRPEPHHGASVRLCQPQTPRGPSLPCPPRKRQRRRPVERRSRAAVWRRSASFLLLYAAVTVTPPLRRRRPPAALWPTVQRGRRGPWSAGASGSCRSPSAPGSARSSASGLRTSGIRAGRPRRPAGSARPSGARAGKPHLLSAEMEAFYDQPDRDRIEIEAHRLEQGGEVVVAGEVESRYARRRHPRRGPTSMRD